MERSHLSGVKEFGDRLKALIFEQGYQTVEQFAHENAIPKGSLSKILNGKVDPKLSTLVKLATALGVSNSQLLDFHSRNQPALVMEKPNLPSRTKRKKTD